MRAPLAGVGLADGLGELSSWEGDSDGLGSGATVGVGEDCGGGAGGAGLTV